MEKSNKYIFGGISLIIIGVIVDGMADKLTTRDGRPDEGGYIRTKILSTGLMLGGASMIGMGAVYMSQKN